MASEAECDRDEIVEEGEGEDGVNSALALVGGGEEFADGAEALAQEAEVGFGFEEGLADGGHAAAEGGVEGQAVVGAIAEEEGGVSFMGLEPLGFVGGGKASVDVV